MKNCKECFQIVLSILAVGVLGCGEGEKTYGGARVQNAWSIQKTADGGAVIAGDTANGSGFMDFYLFKVDALGEVEWTQTAGGPGREYGKSARVTLDGGYIMVGTTESYGPGDPDNHGSYGNIWLIKFDRDGNREWDRVHGHYEYDGANSIEPTSDGGYIIAGYTHSTSDGMFYVLKVDAQGDEIWSRTYGNPGVPNIAKSIKPTTDGGYIVAGTTGFTRDTADSLFIKIDDAGDVIWSETYGENGFYDHIESMDLTDDGGLIAAGSRTSSWPSDGNTEAWVIKIDRDGSVEWDHLYGGELDEKANSIQQTNDGGYVFAGETESFGKGSKYKPDLWIVKLNGTGEEVWNRTYGGESADTARSVQQIDTGYLVAGDKMVGGMKYIDIYLLKLDTNGHK